MVSGAAQTEVGGAYRLEAGSGIADVWWPYQPQPARYTTKVAGEQSRGRLSQILVRDRRGGASPVHLHRDADTTFFIVAGELSVFIGDERIDAGAGSFVFVPQDVAHAFVVRSEEAEYLLTFTPAGIEQFFAEIAPRVVKGEDPPGPAVPDPDELTRRAAEYQCEIVGPPPTLGEESMRRRMKLSSQ